MQIRLPHLLIPILVAMAAWTLPTRALALDVGSELPSTSLDDLSGTSHDPAGYGGSVVLLYFLGTGCGICVDISDQIESDLIARYGNEGLVVLAIDSLDGSTDELTRLKNESGVQFPFLQNGSAYTTECDLKWHGFVVVDADGIVRYVREGADTSAYNSTELDAVIGRYVGDAADAVEKTWGEIKNLFER